MSKTNNNSEYLNARREWNERYGSYIQREVWWKRCSILCLLIVLVSISGTIYLSSKTKFVPYLVEIDKVGRSRAVGLVEKISSRDPRVIRSELASFISNVRLVTTDVTVQKKAIEKVYNHLPNSYPATTFVTNFYKKNPCELALKQKNTVQITSILPMSEETWRIEWDELIFNIQGQHIETIPMKAVLSVDFRTPENENNIIENPIGIFIRELSWTKVIQG